MAKMETKLQSLHKMAVQGNATVPKRTNITAARAARNQLKEKELRELLRQQVSRFVRCGQSGGPCCNRCDTQTGEALENLKVEKLAMKNNLNTMFAEVRTPLRVGSRAIKAACTRFARSCVARQPRPLASPRRWARRPI
jgi:hypothetical protein